MPAPFLSPQSPINATLGSNKCHPRVQEMSLSGLTRGSIRKVPVPVIGRVGVQTDTEKNDFFT